MPKQKSRALVPQSFYDPVKDPTTFYNRALAALETIPTLIEACAFNDDAATLTQLAKLHGDDELELRAAEIRVRAALKIGEISVELPTGHKVGPRDTVQLPSGGKLKAAVLAEAGISTSTAQRYEQLAGGRNLEKRRAVKTVADSYLAACRERQEVASIDGLQSEIDLAFPPPPPRKPRTPDERRETSHSTVVPDEPRTISLTTRIERETYSLPSTARLAPQEATPLRFHRVPSTYEEGVEAAAALLDDMAKEKPGPSLEEAAARVRKLLQEPVALLRRV
jgi:hypothetical protein